MFEYNKKKLESTYIDLFKEPSVLKSRFLKIIEELCEIDRALLYYSKRCLITNY